MATARMNKKQREQLALTAALRYAEQYGWSVIPIEAGTKKARVSWKAYQQTRAGDALIKMWWDRSFKGDGVGIVTGAISGLLVVDIDQPVAAEQQITKYGGLPRTPVVITAKGKHYYFRHPGAGVYNGRLPWGDLKGDGGYVLAPPSIHPETGKEYTWEIGPRECPLAECPPWLFELAYHPPELPEIGGNGRGPAPDVEERIPSGQRNQALASLAGSMRRRGLTAEEIYPTLLEVNEARCEPPLDADEVLLIARSMERYAPDKSVLAPPTLTSAEVLFLNGLPCSDAGNGEALAMIKKDTMRFDHTGQRWLIWDGQRWRQDRDGAPERAAKEVARIRHAAALQAPEGESRDKLIKWAMSSEGRNRMQSALAQAATEYPLATTGEQFDRGEWTLGCSNGVLDLRDGTLVPGEPEQLMTLSTGISYQPGEDCPRWLQFLDEIFKGDRALISFVCRAIGYTLTGSIREQGLFMCHGSGANGKSVFLSVLHGLLGEYAHNADFATFLDSGSRSGSSASPDLVALKGTRLVTASEVKEDRRLNEARIKSLTGGDPVTARPLYGQPMTFVPAFKMWLAVNHRPRIKETGPAIWRRVNLIPFTVTFPPSKADPDLAARLALELPGILNWALAGCLAWQLEGLRAPAIVTETTKNYQNEQDIIGSFLDDCCILGSGKEVKAGVLYKVYKQWAEDNGERPMSSTSFGGRIGDEFEKLRRSSGWVYLGLGLQDNNERPAGSLL